MLIHIETIEEETGKRTFGKLEGTPQDWIKALVLVGDTNHTFKIAIGKAAEFFVLYEALQEIQVTPSV
jgi:hypothetical protein